MKDICLAYGERQLFDQLSLAIQDDEKVGLIGRNGEGKTTIIKLIQAKVLPDSGNIIKRKNLVVNTLIQQVDFIEEQTIIDYILDGEEDIFKIVKNYHRVQEKLENEPNNRILQKEMLRLTSQMDEKHLWDFESEIKTILMKLDIEGTKRFTKSLSGGEGKRVALARTLIRPCDLLLLDEPTNHLDSACIKWLEDYLKQKKVGLLLITHDRYFLDKVTDRIIEIYEGGANSYEGNYSNYQKLKEQEAIDRSKQIVKTKAMYKKEKAWIERGARARSTKQKFRVDRFEEIEKEYNQRDNDNILNLDFKARRLGKKTIKIENVSKSFNGTKVISSFSHHFMKGESIGIIGRSGAGKTTLLNIIMSKIEPDTGMVEVGETVEIGYLNQNPVFEDEEITLFDFVSSFETDFNKRKMLEFFLFPKEDQFKVIKLLSGGERRRLMLLRILANNPNVLIFDEPTNDLDIETLSILERFINEYNGITIVVSHDRYFIDKTCSRLLVFERDGVIKDVLGNYSEYINNIGLDYKNEKNKKDDEEKTEKVDLTKKIKLSFNEKRELDKLPDIISNLEKSITQIEKEMEENKSDYILLEKLQSKKDNAEMEWIISQERYEFLLAKKP